MTVFERRTEPLPTAAVAGLIRLGVGLVGMTAGDLPGIAEQLAAPRWLMGVLGGVLVGSGWLAARGRLPGIAPQGRPWIMLLLFGVLGLALAALTHVTRAEDGAGAALFSGTVINGIARVLFGIGIGIVVGWAAYEGSESRRR